MATSNNGANWDDTLYGENNQYLAPEDYLQSDNGEFKLIYQTDGNLVLYNSSNAAVWASNTNGQPAWRTYMQPDGNLVVYSAEGQAIWASNTNGNAGAFLSLNNYGYLVIYNSSYQNIWSVGS